MKEKNSSTTAGITTRTCTRGAHVRRRTRKAKDSRARAREPAQSTTHASKIPGNSAVRAAKPSSRRIYFLRILSTPVHPTVRFCGVPTRAVCAAAKYCERRARVRVWFLYPFLFALRGNVFVEHGVRERTVNVLTTCAPRAWRSISTNVPGHATRTPSRKKASAPRAANESSASSDTTARRRNGRERIALACTARARPKTRARVHARSGLSRGESCEIRENATIVLHV